MNLKCWFLLITVTGGCMFIALNYMLFGVYSFIMVPVVRISLINYLVEILKSCDCLVWLH